jgi:hypothetical protein
MNAKDSKPSWELRSRDALAPVFADLNKYDATTHFVGQSTIFSLTDAKATGESYCLAHHVSVADGKRHLMIASLRYLDMFVREDGGWLFAERRLYVTGRKSAPCRDGERAIRRVSYCEDQS